MCACGILSIIKGGDMLGGKNSYESIKRYEDKAYDKVLVRMPKGYKSEIQSHAEARSESVNGFINRAITETMERDNAVPDPADSPTEQKKEDA